jgi:hypothetical protein
VALLAQIAAIAMATVLFRAALGKARNLGELAATIRSLGAPGPIGLPAALLVNVAEIIVAVALLFRPENSLTQFGVVGLAAVFAFAGVLALRRDEPIACNCFGTEGGYLGVRQLLLFVPWAGAAMVLHYGAPEVSPVRAAAFLAAIAGGLAAIRAVDILKALSEARGDRRSAEEMYEWLPSY